MVKSEEKRMEDMLKTVVLILISIIILGLVFYPMVEELVLDAYNIAFASDVAMMVALLPVFMGIALVIYVIKSNRMGDI